MATEEKVIISCEKKKESLYYEIQGLDEEKRKLLWEILMEADFSDKNLMRDLIYEFGSGLRGTDKFGRMIFVRLASLF